VKEGTGRISVKAVCFLFWWAVFAAVERMVNWGGTAEGICNGMLVWGRMEIAW